MTFIKKIKAVPIKAVHIYLLLSIAIILLVLWYTSSKRTLPCFRKGAYRLDPVDPKDPNPDRSPFCVVTKVQYALPEDLRIDILKHVDKPDSGSYISIPGYKASRAINTAYIQTHLPHLLEEYANLAKTLSSVIGEPVYTAPLNTPLAVCILSYEKPGDHITWHYDENYFKGRFFTVLIPVTLDSTCSHFEFRSEKGKRVPVHTGKGELLLFEGHYLWHRATHLCKEDPRRVIVSFQYTTNPIIRNPVVKKLKEIGFAGK